MSLRMPIIISAGVLACIAVVSANRTAVADASASANMLQVVHAPGSTKPFITPEELAAELAIQEDSDLDESHADDSRYLVANGVPVSAARRASTAQLDDCEWARLTTSSKTASVSCKNNSADRVVSGQCHSTNTNLELFASAPFENGNIHDPPGHGEDWDDTETNTGWRCQWTGSGSGSQTVNALCCER